jgi:hypothetical protein
VENVVNIEVTGKSKDELKELFKKMNGKGYEFHNYIPQIDNKVIQRTIAMFVIKNKK